MDLGQFSADYLQTGVQVNVFLVLQGRAQSGGASECFGCLGQEKDGASANMVVKQGWTPRLCLEHGRWGLSSVRF